MSGRERLLVGSLVVLATLGLLGGFVYGQSYYRYRGFGPPVSRQPVTLRGSVVTLKLDSAAIGNRSATVYVYVPAAARRNASLRFPTIYLLHGMPGNGRSAYLDAFHLGPAMDDLIAAGSIRPMIAVIPPGSTSTRDKATEWADGPRPNERWDTFLTRDVVQAVDRSFPTIARPDARGIGGYSAGANGAVNAVILHPDVFRVAESWSGDFTQTADLVQRDRSAIRRYSALETVAAAGPTLRRLGAQFWIYTGREDRSTYLKNVRFDGLLRRAGVRSTFQVLVGGHSWKLWHDELPDGLRFFSRALGA